MWFNTAAFAQPPPFTFGNVGRTLSTTRGPGLNNWDIGIHKYFQLKEQFRLQFRAEFFNGLNHTLLNNPNTTVTSSNFGRITSARDPRILQMALKLIF